MIGILIENKKNTYPQYLLIRDLFDLDLDDEYTEGEPFSVTDSNSIRISNWCTGKRPIPADIVRENESDQYAGMKERIQQSILPNMLNISNARTQLEQLLRENEPVIGKCMMQDIQSIKDTASFFTSMICYAISNNHTPGELYSPALSDSLLNCHVPSVTPYFVGLASLSDLNRLIQYGFVTEDTTNKTVSLHPLIQEIAADEMTPSVTNCRTLMDHLHLLCLAHGLESGRPLHNIHTMQSVVERVAVDDASYYLLFLQDLFPYLEKYMATDLLAKLVERMEYIMNEYKIATACDRALLLDYKAELFVQEGKYKNALKKRKRAVEIMEKEHTPETDIRTASLLSNLYNNLSNVYLCLNKGKESAEALKNAFLIRSEYAHLGLLKDHDLLQQMMNLTYMLILRKEIEKAKQVLNVYETIVLEQIGTDTLDHGICQLMHGIIAVYDKQPKLAETSLLAAENTILAAIGEDNDYLRTTYRYLHLLYKSWHKMELAENYQRRLLDLK